MNRDERFRLVVEAAPNAMVLIKADGRIEMVNTQTEAVFGYGRADLIGEPVEMLLPERFRGKHGALRSGFFARAKSRPMGAGRELFGRRKDGSEFPVEIGLNPIDTDEGAMVLSAIVDITERLLNQKLAASGYLAAIVDSSNDAIVGKDLDGWIRSWNPAAETILGYSAEEAIGCNITMLFPPERLAEEVAIADRIRRGKRVEHHETERRCKDGRTLPVSLTISPIRDAQGVIVGASKILQDISAQREAQRALTLSEAEFRASFEGAAVGKVLAEPESRRILRANHALATMLGLEPRQMVGRTMSEFTWPEDRDQDAAEYAVLLSGDSDAHVREQRFLRQDGTPIWIRLSATLARAPDSVQPFLAVIAIEDIDARYRAQAELLDAKLALETVVEERTAALNQRNLLIQEVYHRVKNNLQIVDGLLLMQALRIDDTAARTAVLGLRARVFALGLVHQQLMGSPDLKTFDIASFLGELAHNLIDGGANDAVSITVDACAVEVGLDFAVPLGLLVTELVTNSLKHAFADGSGKIAVILKPDGDRLLSLTVSDDGRGQPHSDGVWTDRSRRTGLGATIVKSLVTQLEGAITIATDRGTTTEIRMPLPAPT